MVVWLQNTERCFTIFCDNHMMNDAAIATGHLRKYNREKTTIEKNDRRLSVQGFPCPVGGCRSTADCVPTALPLNNFHMKTTSKLSLDVPQML